MKMSNKDREDRGESHIDLSPDLGVIDDLFIHLEENGHFFISLLQTVNIAPSSSHKCCTMFHGIVSTLMPTIGVYFKVK